MAEDLNLPKINQRKMAKHTSMANIQKTGKKSFYEDDNVSPSNGRAEGRE